MNPDHANFRLCRVSRCGYAIFGLAALLLAGCPAVPEPNSQPQMADREPAITCGASDARVGSSAKLRGFFHNVGGTVRIVDDCTLAIDDFTFDGGGLDVRVYAGRDTTFENGIRLTGDIRRAGGYRNETLLVPLPAGVTLDDVRAVSIWCLAVNVNFGDAVLE